MPTIYARWIWGICLRFGKKVRCFIGGGSGVAQGWLRGGSGVAQGWLRGGSGVAQGWLRGGSGVTQG